MFSYWIIFLVGLQVGVKVVVADCGLIDRSKILNTDVTFIDYISGNSRVGSKAKLVCEKGAKLSDNIDEFVDCRSSGWNIPPGDFKFRCELLECSPSPKDLVVPHGRVYYKRDYLNPLFSYGSAYTVVCDPGYKIDGSPLRVCMDNGTWSGNIPVCNKIKPKCTEPKSLNNGVLNIVTHPERLGHPNKTVYTVICDTGFCVTRGSPIVICGNNGQWEKEIPECKKVEPDCPKPDPVKNGHIEEVHHKEGEMYNYYSVECDSGFEIKGTRVRNCQDGVWSGTVSTCEPKSSQCQSLFSIQDGRINEIENTYTQVHFYVECDDGYYLKGPRMLRCHRNGTWFETENVSRCERSVSNVSRCERSSWLEHPECIALLTITVIVIFAILVVLILCVKYENRIYKYLEKRKSERQPPIGTIENKANDEDSDDETLKQGKRRKPPKASYGKRGEKDAASGEDLGLMRKPPSASNGKRDEKDAASGENVELIRKPPSASNGKRDEKDAASGENVELILLGAFNDTVSRHSDADTKNKEPVEAHDDERLTKITLKPKNEPTNLV